MRVIDDDFSDIRRRLINWGRFTWRELVRDGPDGACINPIYDMGRSLGDGFGEVTEETVIVEQTTAAPAETLPIDEDDAEAVHVLVRQTPKTAQHAIWDSFVYRRRVPGLGSALRAVVAVLESNRRVVQRMRSLA